MLFNSDCVGIGPRHPRPERGLLSRPALDVAYRRHVDWNGPLYWEADGQRRQMFTLTGMQPRASPIDNKRPTAAYRIKTVT